MTLITPEELADLEAKARAATPGPWQGRDMGDCSVPVDCVRYGVVGLALGQETARVWAYADTAHIAANAPDVTLRLIATIRAVTARAETTEKERDELREKTGELT